MEDIEKSNILKVWILGSQTGGNILPELRVSNVTRGIKPSDFRCLVGTKINSNWGNVFFTGIKYLARSKGYDCNHTILFHIYVIQDGNDAYEYVITDPSHF